MSDTPADVPAPQASDPAPAQPEIVMPMIMSEWDQRNNNPLIHDAGDHIQRFTE